MKYFVCTSLLSQKVSHVDKTFSVIFLSHVQCLYSVLKRYLLNMLNNLIAFKLLYQGLYHCLFKMLPVLSVWCEQLF